MNVKRRIKNVLNYRKPSFWVVSISILTLIIVVIALVTDPKLGDTIKLLNTVVDSSSDTTEEVDQTMYHSSNDNEIDLSDIEKMNIGAEMPRLIYGDENFVVMQGSFGLLVYDMNDSLVTDRLSYVQLSTLGVSMLHAAVSQDGTLIYFGNIDRLNTKFLFTHKYDIKTNTIDEISKQPSYVYTPSVIEPTPGYNEYYDKYFDFDYLIGNTIIDSENYFMYLRANTDWSMKSLQIVKCKYKDGVSEVQNIFITN